MSFTNEELSKKYNNNFKLVKAAITLANNKIESGRDFRVKKKGVDNFAELILEEIRLGEDELVDIEGKYVDTKEV